MRDLLCQRRLAARHPRGSWHHLLADCGHHVIEWAEPEASAVCGDKVTANGKIYKRGGSTAIVIEKIEVQNSKK
jgi:hypothetical protein